MDCVNYQTIDFFAVFSRRLNLSLLAFSQTISRPKIIDCVIIKLGGSILSCKEGGLNIDIIRSFASELAKYRQKVLLVHGGGVFTKRVLIKHDVQSDFLTAEQINIVNEIRKSVVDLNTSLINILKELGLHCISVSPRSVVISRNGAIIGTKSIADVIKNILGNDEIPVLYGDVIDDNVKDYYFCGSDQIVSWLTENLRPKSVLFLTDVDGVYETYPPTSDMIKPLSILTMDLLERIKREYRVGYGEMYDKLKHAIKCASYADTCRIINGKVNGNLIGTLSGQIETGTRVLSGFINGNNSDRASNS